MAFPGTRVTALDLIKSSLRLLNVLDAEIGESPSASMSQDALSTLNQMIDAWNAEHLMIYTELENTFTLVPSQQTYTMGAGGDFNIARPSSLDMAFIIQLGNPSQPLETEIPIYTDRQWANIPVKNIFSTLPLGVYDDKAFPLRNLSFFPIPSVTVQCKFWTWASLSMAQSLTTVMYFPPGYQEAFRFNLAPRLAPEYKVATPIEVAAYAVESKARVKSANMAPIDMQSDSAVLSNPAGFYDWRSDQFIGGSRTS